MDTFYLNGFSVNIPGAVEPRSSLEMWLRYYQITISKQCWKQYAITDQFKRHRLKDALSRPSALSPSRPSAQCSFILRLIFKLHKLNALYWNQYNSQSYVEMSWNWIHLAAWLFYNDIDFRSLHLLWLVQLNRLHLRCWFNRIYSKIQNIGKKHHEVSNVIGWKSKS